MPNTSCMHECLTLPTFARALARSLLCWMRARNHAAPQTVALPVCKRADLKARARERRAYVAVEAGRTVEQRSVGGSNSGLTVG
jgi:hypothetical protein